MPLIPRSHVIQALTAIGFAVAGVALLSTGVLIPVGLGFLLIAFGIAVRLSGQEMPG